jgi:hypothetical protein
MALPRYQNVGVEVAGGIRGLDFPSRGESTRGFDTISAVLDRMSESFFKEAATAATAEGEKYGAENAPSPEQIAEARKLNQPVAPIGDSRTYFGKAASQAASRIAAKNVAVDAELQMGLIQRDVAAGKVSANDVVPRVNALAKGYSSALKEFDPVMARSVEADLALHGNKMFLAASKKATSDAIAAQGAKAAEAAEETVKNLTNLIAQNGPQLLQSGDGAIVHTVQQQLDDVYAKAESQINGLPKAARKEALKNLPVWIQSEFKSFVVDKIVKAKSEDELKPIVESLKTGQYDAFFTANRDQRFDIIKALEGEINKWESKENRGLSGEKARLIKLSDNIMASIDSGKSLDLAILPTKEQVLATFSNDPARGEVIWSQISTAAETNQAWTENKYRSYEELTAKRRQLAQEFKDSPLEQSADRKRKLDIFDRMLSARNQILEKDPAAFASQLPEVRDAYEKTTRPYALANNLTPGQRVAAYENYAEVMTNAQVYLGLPDSAVKILPRGEVDSLIAEWKETTAGGSFATQWLQEQATLYGKAWPSVMKQLQPDLPPTAVIIAGMQDPLQRTAAETLANLSTKPNEDGMKSWRQENQAQAKDINEALNRAMNPFEASIAAYQDSPAVSAAYNNAIRTLATGYVITGKSPSEAVAQAYKEILGSQYSFHDTFRVPSNIRNANRIAQTANELKYYLGEYNIKIPDSLMSNTTGMTDEQRRKVYLESLRDNGKWVNNPDDRFGLIFIDGSGAIVKRENRRVDGEIETYPFALSWDELSTEVTRPVFQFGREIPVPRVLPGIK